MKNKKMSIMGIGTIFIPLSIIYFIIICIINYYTKSFFIIKEIPRFAANIIGIILLIIGIPFYFFSAKSMHEAFINDNLCTTGVYAVCRHPLYSSWIYFIIPGIVIFFRSWLLLTVPIFMYIILIIFIAKEENYLKNRFGDDYLKYKKKTNLSFPKLWKISS